MCGVGWEGGGGGHKDMTNKSRGFEFGERMEGMDHRAGRVQPYLISRWRVCFRRNLLYFISSNRADVFFLFFWVVYREGVVP